MSEENTSSSNVMAKSSISDSEVNEGSDISSQLPEMKNYESKIGELQSDFSQLKDLMMAIINKSNTDSPSTSSQGLSKRPQVGSHISFSSNIIEISKCLLFLLQFLTRY